MFVITKGQFSEQLFKSVNFFRLLASERGVSRLLPPKLYDHVELPANPKLRLVPKVPSYPHGIKPPKMKKMVHLMRTPEMVHNKLIHQQYGIQCIRGGRLKIAHFDVIRNAFHADLDYKKFFAIWRVDAPWQACTKRPVGFTLGGGKGNIHHYVTPVGAGRILVEVAGHGDYEEVEYILKVVAAKMPFPARAISQSILDKEECKEREKIERNMNPYTYEYMIKNNMLDCRKYVKKPDFIHFGKYPL